MTEKIAWVVIRDGWLLVARNQGREKFYLPGDRQEPAETDAQTLAREITAERVVTYETWGADGSVRNSASASMRIQRVSKSSRDSDDVKSAATHESS
jgi:hypothetical protein